MHPLVSIIIPVYNTEKYLEQCLDSIIYQTYKEIEIVLVDDGSTDGSYKICEEYACNDKRIKLYRQKNTGQAAARNNGIFHSNGEYILYADSDDYVNLNYVESLVSIAQEYKADLVQCYAEKFWENGKREKIKIADDIVAYTASQALEEFCYQRKFSASPWGKLIRKKIMDSLEFPVGMGYEDMAIMYKVIGKAKKIVLYPKVLYYYRQHKSSTMHASFSDKKVDRIRVAEQLKQYIDVNFPENSKAVKTRYLLANLQLLMDLPYRKDYKEIRNMVRDNIRSVRWTVVHDDKSKNGIKVMAVASYLGIPIIMLMGRVYKKINL